MAKTYDPDEKMEIVLRVIKGEKISNLVDEYDVSRSSIYLWKNEFLDGGMSKLSGDSITEQEARLKEKDEQIKEMEKIIGQQKVQVEILKKALAELNTPDKIKIINQLKSEYTITELCRTFNIARSTYYYRQNNDQDENNKTEDQLYTGHPAYDKDGNLVPEEDVVQLVKDYCDESPHLGYRMVTDYLNYTENLKVNHKRIYRIMKVLDLLQDKIVPKPKEYQLRQKHELTGPNQLWEMDCEVYRKHYRSITHCRNSIAKFIDKYNNRRPHSSVGKIPPAVYHKNILNNLVSGIKFAA